MILYFAKNNWYLMIYLPVWKVEFYRILFTLFWTDYFLGMFLVDINWLRFKLQARKMDNKFYVIPQFLKIFLTLLVSACFSKSRWIDLSQRDVKKEAVYLCILYIQHSLATFVWEKNFWTLPNSLSWLSCHKRNLYCL